MKHDLQHLIGWKLDDARLWLEQQDAKCAVQIVEIAPPAKPPRRETAKQKSAPPPEEVAKSRERSGDWRVLRCRYAKEMESASTCSTLGSVEESIEIVVAREILRND